MVDRRTALDEASRNLVEHALAGDGRPVHEMSPSEARRFIEELFDPFEPDPMARVFDDLCLSADHHVPLRVVVPNDAVPTVIAFFHGGGWVLGSAAMYEPFCRELANRTRCTVVVVDYRLAPEHPFPAAVDDCYAAVCWVDEHLGELAGVEGKIVVVGDSAGGNLAAVVAQVALDRGGPAIALQALVYPVLDFDLETSSYHDPDSQLLLSRETMEWFWSCYVPDARTRRTPSASPMRRENFAGLPPAFVVTAGYDVLRDEGIAYVSRLEAAGVEVTHAHHADQMHGFLVSPALPGHQLALRQLADAIAVAARPRRP